VDRCERKSHCNILFGFQHHSLRGSMNAPLKWRSNDLHILLCYQTKLNLLAYECKNVLANAGSSFSKRVNGCIVLNNF